MYSVCNDLKGRVTPFGNLRIKACLLAPRSLSQATTSFIACNRQGIHHVHLFTCPYNVSPLRRCARLQRSVYRNKKYYVVAFVDTYNHYPPTQFPAWVHKNLLTSSRLLKNVQHLVSKRPNLNTRIIALLTFELFGGG